jgi:hypothetical protein
MQEGEYKLTIKTGSDYNLVERLALDMLFHGEIGPYAANKSTGELFFNAEKDAELIADLAEKELAIK